jgi:hypothetical protein
MGGAVEATLTHRQFIFEFTLSFRLHRLQAIGLNRLSGSRYDGDCVSGLLCHSVPGLRYVGTSLSVGGTPRGAATRAELGAR